MLGVDALHRIGAVVACLLEQLRSNMTSGRILMETDDALVWKFKKDEIASILAPQSGFS